MDRVVVYQKMRELEVKMHYHFNDIAWLSKAMRSEKLKLSEKERIIANTLTTGLQQSAIP